MRGEDLTTMTEKAARHGWTMLQVIVTLAGTPFLYGYLCGIDLNADVSKMLVSLIAVLAGIISFAIGWKQGGAAVREESVRADKAVAEASDLGKALAVERERVERLNEDLDTQRTLRESDKTIHDKRLDDMRKAHKEEMDALAEHHRELEKSLRLHHEGMEAMLRSELERTGNLRDADRTLAQSRVEELLRENGDVKAELERWRAMYVTEKAMRLEASHGPAMHAVEVAQ